MASAAAIAARTPQGQSDRQMIWAALCRVEDLHPDRKRADALRSLARHALRREMSLAHKARVL